MARNAKQAAKLARMRCTVDTEHWASDGHWIAMKRHYGMDTGHLGGPDYMPIKDILSRATEEVSRPAERGSVVTLKRSGDKLQEIHTSDEPHESFYFIEADGWMWSPRRVDSLRLRIFGQDPKTAHLLCYSHGMLVGLHGCCCPPGADDLE
jgi:hypothetical protein